MDRKYKQRGYSDRDSQDKKREEANAPPASRARSRTLWARALLAW